MEKSRPPDPVRPTKSTDSSAGQGQTNDSGYGKDIKGRYKGGISIYFFFGRNLYF